MDELRRVGLQTFEPGWLASNLDSLLEHEELSFMNDSEYLKKLKANKSKIIETLRELELVSEGLPMTLVHGDLMSSNVYRVSGEPGRFGFFDWDCAFIGHPLLDVLECDHEGEAMESYLEAWSDYQPVSRLRKSLPLLEAIVEIMCCFSGSQ